MCHTDFTVQLLTILLPEFFATTVVGVCLHCVFNSTRRLKIHLGLSGDEHGQSLFL